MATCPCRLRRFWARFLAALAGTILIIASPPAPADAQAMVAGVEMHFLDVGQGDAVLIRIPDGRAVLYDGGDVGVDLLPMLERAGVRSIELVIASHNHADHIGGLPAAIERYRPAFIMENSIPHTTRAYERFLAAAAAAGSQRLEATRRTISLGDVRLHVIPPPGTVAWGHNDNSIGIIVEYDKFRASLLGDAEHALQGWWLREHAGLFQPVAVHKASHHGSRNGDLRVMVERLRPATVVVSSGAGNSYGHPHAESLALYANVGSRVFRTDGQGTVLIAARADGRYEVRTERGAQPPPSAAFPTTGAAPPAAVSTTGAVPQAAGCVDLNTAAVAELRRITHIDQARAAEIVTLRRTSPFRSVDDITRVRGIAAARLRDIKTQGLACVR